MQKANCQSLTVAQSTFITAQPWPRKTYLARQTVLSFLDAQDRQLKGELPECAKKSDDAKLHHRFIGIVCFVELSNLLLGKDALAEHSDQIRQSEVTISLFNSRLGDQKFVLGLVGGRL